MEVVNETIVCDFVNGKTIFCDRSPSIASETDVDLTLSIDTLRDTPREFTNASEFISLIL